MMKTELPFTKEQRKEIAQAAETAGASNLDGFLDEVQEEMRRMADEGADLVKPKEKKHS